MGDENAIADVLESLDVANLFLGVGVDEEYFCNKILGELVDGFSALFVHPLNVESDGFLIFSV